MAKSTAIATRSDPLVTGVDPRVRMKEIRAEVSDYLKGNTFGMPHLGDLPDNMDDARRVIIALQDLLETEKEKHRKATMHICELVHLLNELVQDEADVVGQLIQSETHILQLNQVIDAHEEQNLTLFDVAKKATEERDAVLTTLRLTGRLR